MPPAGWRGFLRCGSKCVAWVLFRRGVSVFSGIGLLRNNTKKTKLIKLDGDIPFFGFILESAGIDLNLCRNEVDVTPTPPRAGAVATPAPERLAGALLREVRRLEPDPAPRTPDQVRADAQEPCHFVPTVNRETNRSRRLHGPRVSGPMTRLRLANGLSSARERVVPVPRGFAVAEARCGPPIPARAAAV